MTVATAGTIPTTPPLDVLSVAPAARGHEIVDISTPMVSAADVVGGLGTYPTVMFPLRRGRPVDAAVLWDHVREPAEFFGLALPTMQETAAAITAFAVAGFQASTAPLLAATLTVMAGGSAAVTGVPAAGFVAAPVRLAALEPQHRPSRIDDDHWLRMAARTVSRAHIDHVVAQLHTQGFADGIPEGSAVTPPLYGALVLDAGGALVGLDSGEPQSILSQLRECGVLADLPLHRAAALAEVERAWWISPHYGVQPVQRLAARSLPVDSNCPSFLETL